MAKARKKRVALRSGFEDRIRALFKSEKIKHEYEPYKLKYVLEANYIPDFVLPNGIHIEVKGYFPSQDRRKMKAVKKSNPDIDIRFWFQRDNWLTSTKKTKYSTWAERNGFPWHVGEGIPVDWIKETKNTD